MKKETVINLKNELVAKCNTLAESFEKDVKNALKQLTPEQVEKITTSPYTFNVEDDNLFIKGIGEDFSTLITLPDYEVDNKKLYQEVSLYDLNVIQLTSIITILTLVL